MLTGTRGGEAAGFVRMLEERRLWREQHIHVWDDCEGSMGRVPVEDVPGVFKSR